MLQVISSTSEDEITCFLTVTVFYSKIEENLEKPTRDFNGTKHPKIYLPTLNGQDKGQMDCPSIWRGFVRFASIALTKTRQRKFHVKAFS